MLRWQQDGNVYHFIFAQIIVNVCAKRVMEKKKKMKNMSSGSLTLHVLTSAFQNFDLSPATKSHSY